MKADMAEEEAQLVPLDMAYAALSVRPPEWRRLNWRAVPERYRALLNHRESMTMVLERYYGDRLLVRPLWTCSSNGNYSRQVILVREHGGQPVEMGAINVEVGALSAEVRDAIASEQLPLGRILTSAYSSYQTRPILFFSITPDPAMLSWFGMSVPSELYGRYAALIVGGVCIGAVVEVLPVMTNA
jgi:chorismate-pyruvate lyase